MAVVSVLPQVADLTCAIGYVHIVGANSSRIAESAKVFARVEAESCCVAQSTNPLSPIGGSMGLGSVFKYK
jgi:hypothetical protein